MDLSLVGCLVLRDLVLMCGRGVELRDEEGVDECWTGVCESDGTDASEWCPPMFLSCVRLS